MAYIRKNFTSNCMPSKSSNIIVGSGITGSIIASKLKHVNLDAQVIEQGQSHGRLSTKEKERADIGAQFFTARSQEFKDLVEQWKDQHLVKSWCTGFPPKNDEYERYCGVDGMAQLVHKLAEDTNIAYDTKVWQITESTSDFIVKTSKGEFRSDHVILTAPLVESLELVKDIIPKYDYEQLSKVQYWPCLTLAVKVPNSFVLNEKGVYQHKGNIIDFIATNRHINEDAKDLEDIMVTIHCSPQFSEQFFNEPEDAIIGQVQLELNTVNELKKINLEELDVELLKWKYSQPKKPFHAKSYHFKKGPKNLIIAGDAFGDSKIEGACLSALNASDLLYKDFQVFY
eukprot:NODE_806_length_4082_cov_0.326638.p1 type:complete len:342 gc:universal NODE_806_length_4082_cov_0.326638:913-1938(+)